MLAMLACDRVPAAIWCSGDMEACEACACDDLAARAWSGGVRGVSGRGCNGLDTYFPFF